MASDDSSTSGTLTTTYETCTEGPEAPCPSCFDSLDDLHNGDVYAGRYVILSDKRHQKNNVRYASFKYASRRKVVLKFYASSEEMNRVAEMYRILSNCEHICSLVDVVEADDVFPSCLVFEKGDYTLNDWIQRLKPDPVTKKSVLHDVVRAIYSLHKQGICHGDLKACNIIWFNKDYAWKLIDLDTAARRGERRRIFYTPTYASPEVMNAANAGEMQIEYTLASDMWSLGIIAYEILTGSRFYGQQSLEEITACLKGNKPLPNLDIIQEPQSRRFVASLLCLDPSKRWTADNVYRSALFRSADDTVQTQTKMLQVHDHLNMLSNQLRSVLDEVRSTNLMLQLSIDYFRRWTKPSEPFHIREGARAFTVQEDELMDNPVWLLRIGSEYRLTVSVFHQQLPLNIRSILGVRMVTPEGAEVPLKTAPGIEETGKYNILAHLSLPEIPCRQLSIVSPSSGSIKEKYVKLMFVVDVVMADAENHVVELGGTLFFKMVPSSNHQWGKKFARAFRRSYSTLPSWTKEAAKGSCFVANLVLHACPAALALV